MINIDTQLDSLRIIWQAVDSILAEHEGTLKFPALLEMLAVKFNWDVAQQRLIDPVVRYYINTHSEWCSSRGRRGGIISRAVKEKQDQIKLVKQQAKEAAADVVKMMLAKQSVSGSLE